MKLIGKNGGVTSNAQNIVSLNCDGSDVSKTSTSLENLESILPMGVTSKNCNGAFITLSNNIAWRTLAARQHARYGIKSAKNDDIAATTSTNFNISTTVTRGLSHALYVTKGINNEYILKSLRKLQRWLTIMMDGCRTK